MGDGEGVGDMVGEGDGVGDAMVEAEVTSVDLVMTVEVGSVLPAQAVQAKMTQPIATVKTK